MGLWQRCLPFLSSIVKWIFFLFSRAVRLDVFLFLCRETCLFQWTVWCMLSFTNPAFSDHGLEQLLWWGGYVWEETCLGKGPGVGCQRDPDSNWPFHSLALDLGASECMELQLPTYMLGIMALALKSGCEVESVHEWSAQSHVWLVNLLLYGYRFGPIQQYFPAESSQQPDVARLLIEVGGKKLTLL